MTLPTKFVVGSTFAVYPPRSGGQLRIFHLYQHLARHRPVDVVALVGPAEPASRSSIAPGLTEIRVPRSAAHVAAETQLNASGVASTDIAFTRLHRLTPAFSYAVACSAVPGCVFLASHPYAFPAMHAAGPAANWRMVRTCRNR